MTVEPKDAPDPWQTFEQAQLPPALLQAVSFSSGGTRVISTSACLCCWCLVP
jgi:hypothetical protein